jgi:hypothetical protein
MSASMNDNLSERDWQILLTVRSFRFLTTRQLARQHFGARGPTCSIPRQVNHALGRLRDLGLLTNLERRIGGVRSGSSGHIWQITNSGNRLLAERHHEAAQRVRPSEPGASFLEHTLAIAETVICLQEASTGKDVNLTRFELEPECWRNYLARGGSTRTLKPDLGAVTRTPKFEDVWFFEVDRDTETPARVVRKCLQYQEYRDTGAEQRVLGIFPAVVWVVPNRKRRETLRTRLSAEQNLDRDLFVVIQPDEIGDLICLGAEDFRAHQIDARGRDD